MNVDKTIPIVSVDKSMDKLRDQVLFEKKLEEANIVLSKIELPKNKHQK